MTRLNNKQLGKLLEILSEPGVLVEGKVTYETTTRQVFWKRVALQLNSVEDGVQKNPFQWCKTWADWKNNTKKKVNVLLKTNHTCGRKLRYLNDIELLLLKMIGFPINEKLEVFNEIIPTGSCPQLRSDFFQDSKTDPIETSIVEIPDFLTDLAEQHRQLSRTPMSSDGEANASLDCFAKRKSKFCDVEKLLDDGDSKSETCEREKQAEETLKTKGQKFKKIKSSLDEFKLRTTLALEKERVQQKSEELRLRALELKLKGEELKLKEAEMNKINYLTTIEEEKLNCFRDISSSLKELLERTRNGNTRYLNLL